MSANMTKKVIPLQFWTCFFLDSKDGNYPTIKPNLILNCRSQGKFLVGEGSTAQYDGHAICIFLCVLVYIIGIIGFSSNVLNVSVLRKTLAESAVSLKCLLVMLAMFELLACLFSIGFATSLILILENVTRGKAVVHLMKITHVLYSYGRTGAIYLTILVTIERYLVVAFPLRSKDWLTPTKSRVYVAITLIITCFLDLPWILNSTVEKNTYATLSPNTSLVDFPYILNGTSFGRTVYPNVRMVQLIMNYVAPFPLLLVFNGLLYLTIYNWNKNRKALSSNQKREINAAKMFSVVVLILLSCHTVACVIVFFAQKVNVVHRELMFLQLVSVTVSSSVNFFVYLGFGKPFRQELRKQLSCLFCLSKKKRIANGKDEPTTGTQSSKDGESSTDNAITVPTNK